ncbi:hypothetical protein [Parvularcula sp. LCG005]|uniref:hypothetical protein n=1 Tax=Parvularcula sp. LCG005 TaxID=3078805 RepID=UPI0029421D3E|nr:hypothetical protein [Parvularcula sp. LCG005]WOI54331.1 hypothetical protein RUI03_04855 [Parvularcula sp. LCG005]
MGHRCIVALCAAVGMGTGSSAWAQYTMNAGVSFNGYVTPSNPYLTADSTTDGGTSCDTDADPSAADQNASDPATSCVDQPEEEGLSTDLADDLDDDDASDEDEETDADAEDEEVSEEEEAEILKEAAALTAAQSAVEQRKEMVAQFRARQDAIRARHITIVEETMAKGRERRFASNGSS